MIQETVLIIKGEGIGETLLRRQLNVNGVDRTLSVTTLKLAQSYLASTYSVPSVIFFDPLLASPEDLQALRHGTGGKCLFVGISKSVEEAFWHNVANKDGIFYLGGSMSLNLPDFIHSHQTHFFPA